ncbi:substrate-binding domain-containing protein [Paenarthrobacter nicotinovorans]|uniref:substrate-binding domain-containing protein n=1 Tax=Paenarthrobacter nicotinovorans TaxID=29320 RepID=UPI003805A932
MKNTLNRRRVLPVAAAISVALAFTGCTAEGPSGGATAADGTAAAKGGQALPIDKLCGDRPIKVAHVAGFGANSWRKITEAELRDELSACPNVKVDYSQADGDLQKYITAINSYTAQGYDAIVTYDDFGSQALSALSNAKKAGVAVVPYIADPGGKVGQDYDGYVAYDFKTEGDTMAKWLAKQVPAGGNVIFTGGLPSGSPSTVELLNAIKSTNDQSGAFKLATPDPIASSWDPAFMQRAMSGVLTKFDKIDGWASDYGVADLGGLRAMVNANRPIPPLATSATDNELGCFWLENKNANPKFQLLTLDGTTTVVRIAGRKALAAVNKLPDNEPSLFQLETFVDTANGKLPECKKDLPPDADLSSGLSAEKLKAVFQ